MRTYSINLEGRVKNFSLPKNRPLIPLYEAVVNSLHAIEERRMADPSFKDGRIFIDIKRSSQLNISNNIELPKIEGFSITDNGIGFNERNLQSFLESDSTYKAVIGGKGVGRFSWLKAFSSVSITSIFKDGGTFVKREFVFSLSNPYINDTLAECEDAEDYSTSVTLNIYNSEYVKYVPKQIETIAMRIVEHCLVYFLDKNSPQIIIRDESTSLILNQIFTEKFKTEDNTTTFQINGMEFALLNVKIKECAFSGNCLYLCANNRLVESKDLERKIVDLDGQIFDQNGFWYVGVLTSQYLDEHEELRLKTLQRNELQRNATFNYLTKT